MDRPNLEAEIWVHGAPARDIEQVISYLSGDAHDRSKVQIYIKVDNDPKQGRFVNFPLLDG